MYLIWNLISVETRGLKRFVKKFDRMLRVVMIKKRKVLFRKTFQINNQAIHFNSIRIRNGIAISKFNLKIWKIEII